MSRSRRVDGCRGKGRQIRKGKAGKGSEGRAKGRVGMGGAHVARGKATCNWVNSAWWLGHVHLPLTRAGGRGGVGLGLGCHVGGRHPRMLPFSASVSLRTHPATQEAIYACSPAARSPASSPPGILSPSTGAQALALLSLSLPLPLPTPCPHPSPAPPPAADLLALLARREAVVAELLALSGLGRIVGQLAPGGDGPLAQSLLRVVCYLAADAGAVAEMYHVSREEGRKGGREGGSEGRRGRRAIGGRVSTFQLVTHPSPTISAARPPTSNPLLPFRSSLAFPFLTTLARFSSLPPRSAPSHPPPSCPPQVGSIPVLMSLVGAAVREVAANPSSSALPPGRATELQLAATALTRLAEHDECSAQIRACNGVTLLGKLLLVQPAKGDGGCG